MTDDREEMIRKRAHEIWEQEGRPQGREAQHWQQASSEIYGSEVVPQEEGADDSAVSGVATPLQPGGITPGGGPGRGAGTVGPPDGGTGRKR